MRSPGQSRHRDVQLDVGLAVQVQVRGVLGPLAHAGRLGFTTLSEPVKAAAACSSSAPPNFQRREYDSESAAERLGVCQS